MIKGDGKPTTNQPVANEHSLCSGEDYKQKQLAIRDVLQLLGGKWKLQILGTLRFKGKMRFMDLLRDVDGIAAKMLSKELQDLEMNQLVTRTVVNSKPITVEYEMTEYAQTLDEVLFAMVDWGIKHRERIMRP
jgi:DNA-binding HxlR family transcriptional regulator